MRSWYRRFLAHPSAGILRMTLSGYLAWARFFDRNDNHEATEAFLLDAFNG